MDAVPLPEIEELPDADAVRDPASGRFAFAGGYDRMCRCGHALGVHVHGGFDCLNAVTGDGNPCDCQKFTPSGRSSKA